MERHCFMPDQRMCTEKCMAYSLVDGVPECALLSVAISASGLIRPKSTTVHPPSAPPPKVNP